LSVTFLTRRRNERLMTISVYCSSGKLLVTLVRHLSLLSDTCYSCQTLVTLVRHLLLLSDTCYSCQTLVTLVRHFLLFSDTCHFCQTLVTLVRHLLLLSDTCYSCQTLEFSRKIFEKYSKPNFIKIRPVGAELFHAYGKDGQTDIRDVANSRF